MPTDKPMATPRWDLPRLVMHRALRWAAAVLGLAALCALALLGSDIDDEVDAGQQLAALVALLGAAPQQDDATVQQQLRALLAEQPLRHLRLEVRDHRGVLLLGPADQPPAGRTEQVAQAIGRWMGLDEAQPRHQQWLLPRPLGGPWRVRLLASQDSERAEALGNLALLLGLLLLCITVLLLSMRHHLQRAFQPLPPLLQALRALGHGDDAPLRALRPMPVTELQAVAEAARLLADELQATQAQRRLLGSKLHSLQEDERARIAHELHDELGQRLTAMRVDTARLLRRLDADAALRPEVQQLAQHCELLQREVRALLDGLQPLGRPGGGQHDDNAALLLAQLQQLVQGWDRRGADGGPRFVLRLHRLGADGQLLPWSDGAAAALRTLRTEQAQVLYRISQEALTNAARHAQARQVCLQLLLRLPLPARAQAGQSQAALEWSVCDDGVGLANADSEAAIARGKGLAGIHQRLWAVGADLQLAPCHADQARPGLRLNARLLLDAAPPPAPA